MFYAAIIIILLGILVFVYSVSVEKAPASSYPSVKKQHVQAVADIKTPRLQPVENLSEPVEISSLNGIDDLPEPDLFAERQVRSENKIHQSEDPDGAGDISSAGTVEQNEPVHNQESPDYENIAREEDGPVLMYEDSSGQVEYGGAPSEIDSTLEKYKKIKLIGEGTISAEKNGISFHIDKKLYRYDYHRISEINTGEQYIAVRISGQPQVKLFIFRGTDERIQKIADDYQSFRGKVS